MRTLCLLVCLFWLFSAAAVSAQAEYLEGEFIVQLQPNTSPKMLQKRLPALRLSVLKSIEPGMNIWRLRYENAQISQVEGLAQLRKVSDLVKIAQNNHRIQPRTTTPNDPQFGQQWQYINNGANGGAVDADIDAELAWDISTGGLTALGDTIVVCVIDGGLDLNHQDFGTNRWFNYAEIPNNGIDDDQNGFVDDFNGWNADSNNDDIAGDSHGTSVAGIIGAKGNNGVGVTGINWNVKLMIVVGGGNEADALAAYAYPLAMRRLYNRTNRQQGAFVVATNASWGINNLRASDAPLWCAFYDSLGVQGILNMGATTNNNTNVDTQGDMPTSCASNYLIAVTNMRRDDTKEPSAGYGVNSVDLGAFGSNTWTTARTDTYAAFGGTSGATPHVTGTAALIMSAPCPRLAVQAQLNPAGVALQIKDFILNGVDANTSLQGITRTGGRLNTNNAMLLAMQSGCALTGCYEPYNVHTTQITRTQIDLIWAKVPTASRYQVRWREQGQAWRTETVVDTSLILDTLQACTVYEVQIQSDCDTAQSANARTYSFKTIDCCNAPATIQTLQLNRQSADFQWNSDAFVQNYILEYNQIGQSAVNTLTLSSPSVSLGGLLACTNYRFRLLSNCVVNVNNQYSNWVSFKTKGCGACEDSVYCANVADDASYEWIDSIALGGIRNRTGGNLGYGNFAGTTHTTTLTTGVSTSFYYKLSQQGSTPTWRWRTWLDMNQNGAFESSELLDDSGADMDSIYAGALTVPNTALAGQTRLRIAMKWGSLTAEPCVSYTYGEVEDYCVYINNLNPVEQAPAQNIANSCAFFPNPVSDVLNIRLFCAANASQTATFSLYNPLGQLVKTQLLEAATGENTYQIPTQNLEKGIYWAIIRLENGSQWTTALNVKF